MDELIVNPARPELKIRSQKPVTHRLTVVGSFYHQLQGGGAEAIDVRYDRELKSDEQFYKRDLKVGKEAKKLSLGWIAEDDIPIGLIIIKNTDKRKDEWLELVFIGSEAYLKIRTGEHLSFDPMNVDKICIRGSNDAIEYTISVIPG